MPPSSYDQARSLAKKRLAVMAVGTLAGVAFGLAAVYGVSTLTRNVPGDAACKPAAEMANRLKPLIKGEIAALAPATAPVRVADRACKDAEGKERKLSEWGDRLVLLNLWATWCVPCRKEMPALEELQKKLGGPSFEVVAVNIDTRDADKPKAWLKEVGISGLTYYADPTAKIFQDLKERGKAFGMPTTLLVDGKGCEVATLAGPAEWASEDAVRFIEAALKK
jgi:thiol-disulfide isomerase/thioredoxin